MGAHVITKYPSLNRVKGVFFILNINPLNVCIVLINFKIVHKLNEVKT